MLKPAILYKSEIEHNMLKYQYTDDMVLYYSGYLSSELPKIEEYADGNTYRYAIVDKYDKVLGYFSYYIDWYASSISDFGLFSFDRGNYLIGIDVYKHLMKVIRNYHIHRMEWQMASGNPAEKHYDIFCHRYDGKKFILTDRVRDRYGHYRNQIIYEILFDS